LRRLIIGDIHGMYERMIDVLDRAGFDREKDSLYSVGDICDRGNRNVDVISFLMKLRNFLPVAGNHDVWLYEYLSKMPDPYWVSHNGGGNTFREFEGTTPAFRNKVRKWLGEFPVARIIDGYIIVHGGPATMKNEEELSRMGAFDMTVERAVRYKMITGRTERVSQDITRDCLYLKSALFPERAAVGPLETGRTIICGHNVVKEVFRSEPYRLIDIDTGSFLEEGFLSVMDLDSGKLFRSR